MKLDEALSLTIVGYHVRHDGMDKGAFIHYEFRGFERNGKPWTWNEADEAADWQVINPSIDMVNGLCQTLWDTFLAPSEQEEAPFYINRDLAPWTTNRTTGKTS